MFHSVETSQSCNEQQHDIQRTDHFSLSYYVKKALPVWSEQFDQRRISALKYLISHKGHDSFISFAVGGGHIVDALSRSRWTDGGDTVINLKQAEMLKTLVWICWITAAKLTALFWKTS